MNTEAFIYGITEVLIAVLFGTFLLFQVYRLLEKTVKSKYEIDKKNTSYGIFMGFILISVSYIIVGIQTPILTTIRLLNAEVEGTIINTLSRTIFHSISYLTVLIIAIAFVLTIAIKLFDFMTKGVDEFTEIKNNNIAISIILSAVVLSIAMLTKDSIYLIIESLVPYPEIKDFI